MGQPNPWTTLDTSAVCYTCKGEGRDMHVHVYDGSVLNNSDNVTFTKKIPAAEQFFPVFSGLQAA